MSQRLETTSSTVNWGCFVCTGRQAPLGPSLLHREKKPKEVMGGFSRRCSKLINSCEYLETELETYCPGLERCWLSAVGWGNLQGEPEQSGGCCLFLGLSFPVSLILSLSHATSPRSSAALPGVQRCGSEQRDPESAAAGQRGRGPGAHLPPAAPKEPGLLRVLRAASLHGSQLLPLAGNPRGAKQHHVALHDPRRPKIARGTRQGRVGCGGGGR